MSETKWRIVNRGSEKFIESEDGTICDMMRNDCRDKKEVHDCDQHAKLIAAAPELLEACKNALDYISEFEKDPDENVMMGELQDAIKKANGGK